MQTGVASGFSAHETENLLDPFPRPPSDPLSWGVTVLTAAPGANTASGHFTGSGFGCRDSFDPFRM